MNDTPASSPTRWIWTLGSLRLQEGQGEPATVGGKALTLLAYLLVHPDTPHPREVIAEALWPDSDPAQSRRQLSDTLYRLRQVVSPDWFFADRERIGLRVDEGLWVDAWAFEQLAQSDHPAQWAEAVALYKGEFLPEVYEDWALLPRLNLQERYIGCLNRLARETEEDGRFAPARVYYQQLVNQDPLNEAGYRGLMRSLASLGRPADALEVYDNLVAFLAEEMDLLPATPTRQLAQQIEKEWRQTRRERAQLAPPPFIGRAGERARLLTALDRARQGESGLAVLLGEAGMGKTRLLQELVAAAEWRGWRILWGYGEEFGLPPAYAPLTQALAAVPRPRWQQLKQLVEPFWLSLAAHAIPGLAASLKLPPLLNLEEDYKQLPQAIARVLLGLQEIAPHLILLDDAQWADPTLWELLDSMQPHLNQAALLLVVSGRSAALRSQETAWRKVEAWDRQGQTVIHLDGLSLKALSELAAAQQAALSPEELARLRQASGGNPLLALALLAEADWTALPAKPSLAQLIERRLRSQPAERLQALQTAAVIGYHFDYATWTAVADHIPAAQLPAIAGELEQDGLLALEKDAYRFAHDTLRSWIYHNIPPERRQRIHRRLLAYLAEQERPDPFVCLHHAQESGQPALIARFSLQVGRAAAVAFDHRAAYAYFSQALTHVEEEDEMWAQALDGRIQAAITLALHEEVAADVQRLLDSSRRQADGRQQAKAYYYAANIAWMKGRQAEARQQVEAGLDLLRQETEPEVELEARLLETLARIARDQGDYETCQKWVAEALAHYRAAGNELGQAAALDKLANLRFEAGDYRQAAEQHRQAAEQFNRLGATLYEARALNGLALALRYLGQYDEAQAIHERCLAIARQFQDRYGEWIHLVNLGNIAFELGDYDRAVARYEQALPVPQQMEAPRGVSMTLNNLGLARRGQEDFTAALACFEEAIAINREHGYRSGEGHSQNGRGLTLLDAGQYEAAAATLNEAITIWQELEDRLRRLDALAGLALAHVALEQPALAQPPLQTALELLRAEDTADTRKFVYYAAYRVYAALGQKETAIAYLHRAETAMKEIARALTPEQLGHYRQISLNRQIEKAVADLVRRESVSLVRGDIPLGRKLTPDDYVTVTWDLYHPEDEALPPQSAGRRRQALLRLARQARAQGAVATDSDLAQALGVSRRTILRDIQALTEAGHEIPTRRRSSTA